MKYKLTNSIKDISNSLLFGILNIDYLLLKDRFLQNIAGILYCCLKNCNSMINSRRFVNSMRSIDSR